MHRVHQASLLATDIHLPDDEVAEENDRVSLDIEDDHDYKNANGQNLNGTTRRVEDIRHLRY